MRRALIEETAAENASLTNAAWAHEDALDAAFERTLSEQVKPLHIRASAACGHALPPADAIVQLSTGSDDWIAANIIRYHDLFRAHQVWATRSRVRLPFVLRSGADDARREFDALELALGGYEVAVQARRAAYDVELVRRDKLMRDAISDVEGGKRRHDVLHELFDPVKVNEERVKFVNSQKSVDHEVASKAQDRLFKVFEGAKIAAPASIPTQ